MFSVNANIPWSAAVMLCMCALTVRDTEFWAHDTVVWDLLCCVTIVTLICGEKENRRGRRRRRGDVCFATEEALT